MGRPFSSYDHYLSHMIKFENIPMGVLIAYERLTGKDGLEVIGKTKMTATDVQGVVFIAKRSLDPNFTLEDVEKMTTGEVSAVMSSIREMNEK